MEIALEVDAHDAVEDNRLDVAAACTLEIYGVPERGLVTLALAERVAHVCDLGADARDRLSLPHEAHVGIVGRLDPEVRAFGRDEQAALVVLELLDAADPEIEEFLERRNIDAVPIRHGLGADELLEHARPSLP